MRYKYLCKSLYDIYMIIDLYESLLFQYNEDLKGSIHGPHVYECNRCNVHFDGHLLSIIQTLLMFCPEAWHRLLLTIFGMSG